VKRNVGDLTLLAGSKLKVIAKTSLPVKKATIRLAGPGKEIPMRIDPKSQVDISGQFDIPAKDLNNPGKDLSGFSLQLTSTDGVESSNTAVYRVEIVPDREPTVKVLWPQRREELATSKARFLVAFEAKDDFGITKAELHYTLDGGAEKTIPFQIGGTNETLVKRHFDWEFEKFTTPLAPGNTIEFWLTVQDTNTVTGPGVGITDHYQVKIVTVDEKIADINNRKVDVLNGVGEVKAGQEPLINELGGEIFARPTQ
jgi:hypothetical protein